MGAIETVLFQEDWHVVFPKLKKKKKGRNPCAQQLLRETDSCQFYCCPPLNQISTANKNHVHFTQQLPGPGTAPLCRLPWAGDPRASRLLCQLAPCPTCLGQLFTQGHRNWKPSPEIWQDISQVSNKTLPAIWRKLIKPNMFLQNISGSANQHYPMKLCFICKLVTSFILKPMSLSSSASASYNRDYFSCCLLSPQLTIENSYLHLSHGLQSQQSDKSSSSYSSGI